MSVLQLTFLDPGSGLPNMPFAKILYSVMHPQMADQGLHTLHMTHTLIVIAETQKKVIYTLFK